MLQQERLNQYRIMWIMVLFDLPTETATEKRDYGLFRKHLMKNGFYMFQFSIYIRHCSSKEHVEKHVERIKKGVPSRGHIGILCITDKQFGEMKVFYGSKAKKAPCSYAQIELF